MSLRSDTTSNPAERSDSSTDWREEYAYTIGVQAYTYAFPLIYMSELRYSWVTDPDSDFYAALNHFHHSRILVNHETATSGGSPNQDTLYSFAWMDLRDGPVILSHPNVGARYFTFEIADYHSDNFAYVGKRTTGSQGGAFAIVPRGWSGTLPPDIVQSFESPTTFVLIFGRTLVDGEDDVPAVNALQDQYHMTPLAFWGQDNPVLPENRDVFKPYERSSDDPLADWRTINRAWSENPLPPERDRDLIELFAREIGVGPGFSAETLDELAEPTRRGLERAAVVGYNLLEPMMVTGGYRSKIVNGWSYPPPTFGRAGLAGDFVTRAALQSRGGIIANDPEEATYLNTFVDINGSGLVGGRYVVRFDADTLPPVTEFWSLTIYGMDSNFVPNDLYRYSIGDRTPDIVKDADGSFTIYIQPTAPEAPAELANWLPCPSEGTRFYLVLRTYGPEQPIVAQTWEPPAVTPLDL